MFSFLPLSFLSALPSPLAPKVYTSARLFYRNGASDKEYHAAINRADGGYTVTFAFGRRGSALTAGTKTAAPVPLEKARQIYDKLLAEKTAKGYTPVGVGTPFAATDKEKRVSGLIPQLLSTIDEAAARKHLADDAWCLQEKLDGKRIMVCVKDGQIEGSNRKGLCVPLPQEIVDSLTSLPNCEIDGELLGESYVVFDVLRLDGNDLRFSPYRVRHEVLRDLLRLHFGPCASVVETAWRTADKQVLYSKIAAAGGEGVVFKKVGGVSIAGRPASGGSQVKCKFYSTCTCLVAAENDQRSVRLSLLDALGKAVGVGSVSIPINQAIPPVGATVEVRYLYAYKGGSLYQTVYLGERDDIEAIECVLSQLKFKAAGSEAEE